VPPLGRDFARFWFGDSVSLVGSEVTHLAMSLLAVVALGASAGEMGVLRAVQFVPPVRLPRCLPSAVSPASSAH